MTVITQRSNHNSVNWFMTVIRVAGVNFPIASSLIQLESELADDAVQKRIQKLEDPISNLHSDIPELCKLLYHELETAQGNQFSSSNEFCSKFLRPLKLLETQGAISCVHCIGRRYPYSIQFADPSFIMYLCSKFGDNDKMKIVVQKLEACKNGQWINGKQLSKEIGLSLVVVVSVLKIYEAKGYGKMSRELGNPAYCGN